MSATKIAVNDFDVQRVRADFPILDREIHGRPLVYLDSAATTQKPRAVLDAMNAYYEKHNANVHRGVHLLSQEATELYDGTRHVIRRRINAADSREIVYTRGTTEAINLVAQSWGGANLQSGDEVLITEMEHHSNIVPWQMICEKTGAKVRAIPVTDDGELQIDALDELLNERTKMVAVVHLSNALGTVNPIEEIVKRAHSVGAKVLVDGAQSMQHLSVDVQELGCDFYAFSGHKMYGPTGVGVLYGRLDLLADMPPYQGGGDMIRSVTIEKTEYADPPQRFEAGTPSIAEVAGLRAAIDYLDAIDGDELAAHESDVLDYGTQQLLTIPGLKLQGTAANKASILAFTIDNVHPHDIGTIVDQHGVAIRTGHHCTQPLMDRIGVPATARASIGMYNTREDIDALVVALKQAVEVFA